jgi:hypothetical protein
METLDFRGRVFNVIGRFSEYTVLAHIETSLDATEGMVINHVTDVVAESFGPHHRYATWTRAVKAIGVPLFRVLVNGTSKVWADNDDAAIGNGMHLMMGDSRPDSIVIVADEGKIIATLARTRDGVSVVWTDGRVTRWRQLTWVVLNGEPVALVGTVNGLVRQVTGPILP